MIFDLSNSGNSDDLETPSRASIYAYLLQTFYNAIARTVVQQLTGLQLT